MSIGGQTYKNHLDGYNQMDLITGKGPSARHEIFYFGESQLGAIRIDDFKFQFYQQPFGWPGEKTTTDMPTIVNLRQDPFERTPSIRGQSLNDLGGGYMNDFMAREFWRFVQVQQTVAAAAQSFIDYPPMQQAASFNLAQVKARIEEMMKCARRAINQPRMTGAPLRARPFGCLAAGNQAFNNAIACACTRLSPAAMMRPPLCGRPLSQVVMMPPEPSMIGISASTSCGLSSVSINRSTWPAASTQ